MNLLSKDHSKRKILIHHNLKTWPVQFEVVRYRHKLFEYRKDDRGFAIGQYICLKEFDPHTRCYTQRFEVVRITHVERGPAFGIPAGYVVMGIEPLTITENTSHDIELEPLATADGRPYLAEDLG